MSRFCNNPLPSPKPALLLRGRGFPGSRSSRGRGRHLDQGTLASSCVLLHVLHVLLGVVHPVGLGHEWHAVHPKQRRGATMCGSCRRGSVGGNFGPAWILIYSTVLCNVVLGILHPIFRGHAVDPTHRHRVLREGFTSGWKSSTASREKQMGASEQESLHLFASGTAEARRGAHAPKHHAALVAETARA